MSAFPPAPPPPIVAPALVASYHPPPTHPPAGLGQAAPIDGRAITSLAAAVTAIAFGLFFGVRSLAVTGWVLGFVATAIGAVVSLVLLVVLLVWASGPAS